jgi:hypothetical protein
MWGAANDVMCDLNFFGFQYYDVLSDSKIPVFIGAMNIVVGKVK